MANPTVDMNEFSGIHDSNSFKNNSERERVIKKGAWGRGSTSKKKAISEALSFEGNVVWLEDPSFILIFCWWSRNADLNRGVWFLDELKMLIGVMMKHFDPVFITWRKSIRSVCFCHVFSDLATFEAQLNILLFFKSLLLSLFFFFSFFLSLSTYFLSLSLFRFFNEKVMNVSATEHCPTRHHCMLPSVPSNEVIAHSYHGVLNLLRDPIKQRNPLSEIRDQLFADKQ
ncbi:hypothetical protein CR513_59356, partial [Mucuna pruriens]